MRRMLVLLSLVAFLVGMAPSGSFHFDGEGRAWRWTCNQATHVCKYRLPEKLP